MISIATSSCSSNHTVILILILCVGVVQNFPINVVANIVFYIKKY